MSIAYTDLKNAVVGKLEIDADDADRFELDAHLAAAQLKILNTVPSKFIPTAVTTVRFDLDIGVNAIQWPNNFVRFIRLWVDFASSITEANPGLECLEPPEEGYIPNIAAIATKRYPYIDLNVEDGFAIYPIPDANVTNGGRLRHVWKLPDPTSTQDCLLRESMRNLMIYETTRLCALVEEWNVELSKAMMDSWNDEIKMYLPEKGGRIR